MSKSSVSISRKSQKRLLALLSSGALTASSLAVAQTAPAPQADQSAAAGSAAAPAEEAGLQEIIVTGTRRAVDLQQVAGTVEALPASALVAFDVTSALQLPNLVPGLTIIPSGGNNMYLRGIGSASTGYNEAQVAVYIDGLYLPNPAMSIYSFNNIDQLEVLKGPQGTLYGRNTTGGLISVTTRDPDLTQQHLDVSVGYGNYQTKTGNLYASMPLTSTLAANIAVYSSRQSEGWGKNVFTGNDNQRGRETGIQSKLLWEPQDGTKVTLSGIYDSNNRDFGYAYEVYPGTIANDGTVNLGRYRSADRIDPSAPFTSYMGSLKIEQDVGFADFKSITGYQQSHQLVLFPGASPAVGQPLAGQGVVIDLINENNHTLSQEFQLTSKKSDSRLDWIAGAFLYRDNSEIGISSWTTCVAGVCAPGYTPTDYDGFPTTRSYSGYADATYRFFSATHLTAGLRYTGETKGLSGLVSPLPGFPDSVVTLPATTVTYPGQPYAGHPDGIPTSLHFSKLTYRVVLAQDFGDDIHAYISDNLGFKSGAYNANLFTNPPVQPEVLYAYEAGLKSEFFDHKVRVNLAYFYNDYTDVQVRSTAAPAPPGNALLENVASEHISGVDGDFQFAPTASFTLNGGFEFLNAKYANFPGTTCSHAGPPRVVGGVTLGTVVNVACNLAGNKIAYIPPVTANLGFNYKIETSVALLTFNLNDHYSARRPLAPDNSISDPAHNIVDASLLATSSDKHSDVQLYIRNLTNQYTYAGGLVSNSYAVFPGAPRIYGITIGYHY